MTFSGARESLVVSARRGQGELCLVPSLRQPLAIPGLALILVSILVLTLGAGPAAAGRLGNVDPIIVANPLLGPEYSQWMIGPIFVMASKEEFQKFQTLVSDEEAKLFIEEFWKRRDPVPLRPDNPLRKTFENRAMEADRLYGEAGIQGRRTARGTILILYGEPAESDYQVAEFRGDPPIETWEYDKKAEKGLDGKKPTRLFRFIKRGELTLFYERPSERDRLKRRLETPPHRRPQ